MTALEAVCDPTATLLGPALTSSAMMPVSQQIKFGHLTCHELLLVRQLAPAILSAGAGLRYDPGGDSRHPAGHADGARDAATPT
ncbi:hypothetical protein HS048_35425 [Planomonospora sp. ID91781]|uniref:hypothetical protein n=1 Tax=Planomonospora sp. ID91781 TaxID=2738135 RepID=UPI0018C3971F|nr:hypothetical protein [Planomonospora sp. ID91781]MBG0825964.1 hypothetical protein [Planomonospora sp. ID91781]